MSDARIALTSQSTTTVQGGTVDETQLLSILAAISLAGCHKIEFAGGSHHIGRYQGIGIYFADGLWKQLSRKDAPKDPQLATLADDSEIIVTVDSRTGEVRQCGNFSGYCISSSPWKGPAAAAPASVSEHRSDLEREANQKAVPIHIEATVKAAPTRVAHEQK